MEIYDTPENVNHCDVLASHKSSVVTTGIAEGENAEVIVQITQMENDSTKQEYEANGGFLQAVNNVAATSSSSEVVYAFDKDGNEVAIGLLVSGPFEEVNASSSAPNCEWIAAQEECAFGEVIAETQAVHVKPEVVHKKTSNAVSSVVKTYKKKCSKRTLQQLKAQLAASRNKATNKKLGRKSVPSGRQKMKESVVRRSKKLAKKRIADKLYKAPSSVRKTVLPLKDTSRRKIRHPPKFSIYWDMNIPTQFYEEEYIEFEKYLEFTKITHIPSPDNPYAKSEFCLQQFEMFEKFRRSEEAKYRKLLLRNSGKAKGKKQNKNTFVKEEMKEDKECVNYASDSQANQSSVSTNAIVPMQINEINFIKFAIVKSLSSGSQGRRGKYTSVKNITVDLPLSQKVFAEAFPINYNFEESFREVVSIMDLNTVFGENWHIVNFKESSTRKRVIGVVAIHYRKKANILSFHEMPLRKEQQNPTSNSDEKRSFWIRLKFQAVKENIDVQNRFKI